MAQAIYVRFSGRMLLATLPELGERRKFIVEADCIKRGEELRSDDEECLTVAMKMVACYEPGKDDPNQPQAEAMFDRDGTPTASADPDIVDAQVEGEDEPAELETAGVGFSDKD
jgi:hypothetical protein